MDYFKASPSDLTFLWSGCRRCFWLKVRLGIAPPSIPMPSIFGKIHSALRQHFEGKRTERLIPALPPGEFVYGERWLYSKPITPPGCSSGIYFRGRIDMGAAFDDGTFGVIDFKTAEPRHDNVALYARQLHAYAFGLENPDRGPIGPQRVTHFGLYCVTPGTVVHYGERHGYEANDCWLPIERNDQDFMAFLTEVIDVLERSEPPPASETCHTCRYVRQVVIHRKVA